VRIARYSIVVRSPSCRRPLELSLLGYRQRNLYLTGDSPGHNLSYDTSRRGVTEVGSTRDDLFSTSSVSRSGSE